MKKIILSLLLVLGANLTALCAQEIFSADDSRITYVGRTWVENHEVSFDWTATYIRFAFKGNQLALKVSDTHKNYYNVWIDKPMAAEPDQVIVVHGKDTVITLFAAKKKGQHTVTIQKRTEGEQGTTTIHQVLVHGELTQAEPLKSRQLEFVGDSYTCGYGSENSVARDPFKPETENSSKTYAAILARYFDADYVAIAHSGMGIARNYNTKFAGWYMPDRYQQTFDMDSTMAKDWNAKQSNFKPAMTIIYLGANDFSVSMQPKYEAFAKHYNRLLKQIKENYGEDHPILCCTCKSHEYLFIYVRDMANACGLKNVTYLGCNPALHHDNDTDLGASSHPNYQGHQKLAHVFLPYVATLTGWELQDKPIK